MNNKEYIVRQIIQEALEQVFPAVVGEDFIAHRNALVLLLGDGNRKKKRTIEEKRFDTDATLMEFLLIKHHLVTPPLDINHDFIINGDRIEIKVITNDSLFVTDRLKSLIVNNLIGMFGFLKYITPHNKILMPGDVVNMKLLDVKFADFVKKHTINNLYNVMENL